MSGATDLAGLAGHAVAGLRQHAPADTGAPMTTQAAREQHGHEPGLRLPDSPYGTAQAPAGSIPAPLAGLVGNQAMTNHLSARHPASPLPDGFRQQAEHAFGRNLSHVRLREDPGVSDLGAIAATYGSDIHLAPSAPEPSTPEGQRLLLHELTHVSQQPPSATLPDPIRLSEPNEPAEQEAAAVAEGRVSPSADHGAAAAGTVHRQVPMPVPVMPPPGIPPGLIASQILGDVGVGTTALGQGTGLTLQGATLVGTTTTVAEGTTVTVGAVTVGTEATVVTGGTLVAAPAASAGGAATLGAAATVGVVVIAALVVAAGILFVAAAVSAHKELETEEGKEPGTKDLLPGGAPPQVIAPPAGPRIPVKAPGASKSGPSIFPGGSTRGPVTAPGAAGGGPVKAPGVVDNPDECLQLIKSKTPHSHHIFPQEYVNEFEYLGIEIDDFTVKLPWDKHIGRRGIHKNLDWNGEWGEFFEKVPNTLTDDQRLEWAYKAIDKAIELMQEMMAYLKDKNLRKLVKHRTNTPSPTLPPKTPNPKKPKP